MKNMKGAKRFVRNRDILSTRSPTPLTTTIKNIPADLLESQNVKAKNPRASWACIEQFFFCRLIKKIFVSSHVPTTRWFFVFPLITITSHPAFVFAINFSYLGISHQVLVFNVSSPLKAAMKICKLWPEKISIGIEEKRLIKLLIEYFSVRICVVSKAIEVVYIVGLKILNWAQAFWSYLRIIRA